MKKILIFGATGNTGAYLVDYFFENYNSNEYEIICLGSRDTDFFSKYKFKYIKIDISDKEDFKKLPLDNIHAVIHTAARLPTHDADHYSESFININIKGTLNILEYCRKTKTDRVIFTQTMSNIANEFGKTLEITPNLPRNFPFKGDHVLYVLSKNLAEDIVEHYHQQHGIKTFVFKIPTIYQYRENPYWFVDGVKKPRVFHQFIELAKKGKTIEMWGDPSAYKDLVYVKDYCQQLYNATFVENLNRGVYNVGTGIPTRLDTMLEEIVNVFSEKDNKSSIIAKPDKPNTPSYVINIDNAKKELGYKVKFGLKEMLIDIKKEMKENRFISLRKNE
jgi:UDP-glucose 4-epimerase